jgi:hypothetical protein
MGSEEFILYGSLLLVMVLIARSYRISKKFSIVNAIIFFSYSSYMLYGLLYRSQYGKALAWWFYLLCLTLVHLLVVSVYLIKNRNKK